MADVQALDTDTALVTMTELDVARFWQHVDQSGGPDACWPWKVGTLSFGVQYRVIYAPRIAYIIAYGAIPAGHRVYHRCKTRRCCNPKCLYTYRSNWAHYLHKGG